jgi:hypothetical protein
MVRLEETGGAVGQAVLTDAVRAEISAPDGTRWQSDWENADNYKFLAGESRFSLGFSMAIADFRKFEGKPLAVHLVMALSQAQAGRTTTLGLPQGKFSIPEFGVCSPKTGWTPLPGQISGLDCVAPLRVSPLTFISTQWSDGPCTGGPAGPESGPVGQAWLGSLDRMPAEMNISPVVEQHLNLSNATANETEDGQSRPRFRSLCPGTPITFTEYNRVRRMQTALDIQGFYLPKLTEANGQFSVTE